MSVFDRVAQEKTSAAFGLDKLPDMSGLAVGGAMTIGMGMLKSKLPIGVGPKLNAVGSVIGRAVNGDWNGALTGIVNSNLFASKLPWLDNAAALGWFQYQQSRAMGGVTPAQAQRIMRETLETNFSKKNLFLVSAIAKNKDIGDVPLNLFVTDVSYGPITITADAHKIGSAVVDQPNGTEPVELRLTTMDDESGTVRRWFDRLSSNVTRTNGTFGLPCSYLVNISILHSFISDESEAYWLGSQKDKSKSTSAWKKQAFYRPVSLESDLSRKEDGLEEFTLVFHQFDTFYS